jgi:hypothetical protein
MPKTAKKSLEVQFFYSYDGEHLGVGKFRCASPETLTKELAAQLAFVAASKVQRAVQRDLGKKVVTP